MLAIAALRRWGQAVHKFQANLIYIVRSYLKQNKPFFLNHIQTVYTYTYYLMHIRYFQVYSLKLTVIRTSDFNIFLKGCEFGSRKSTPRPFLLLPPGEETTFSYTLCAISGSHQWGQAVMW